MARRVPEAFNGYVKHSSKPQSQRNSGGLKARLKSVNLSSRRVHQIGELLACEA